MYCRKPQRARSDFTIFFQMERMAENLTRIGNHNEPSASTTPGRFQYQLPDQEP